MDTREFLYEIAPAGAVMFELWTTKVTIHASCNARELIYDTATSG